MLVDILLVIGSAMFGFLLCGILKMGKEADKVAHCSYAYLEEIKELNEKVEALKVTCEVLRKELGERIAKEFEEDEIEYA